MSEEDNIKKPEENKQLPIFTNIPAIKKALADSGYTDKFTLTFQGSDIAAGCDVIIKDKRQAVIGRAQTVVPSRPIIDSKSASVYLEVFFANLQLIEGPEQNFVITVDK